MTIFTEVSVTLASCLIALVAAIHIHRQVISPWMRRRSLKKFWREYAKAV